MNVQMADGLEHNAVEKARESETKARREGEVAKEEAIMAKDSAIKSVQITKELFQEAKRKARAARIAARKTKIRTKLVVRMTKEAKEAKKPVTSPSEMTNSEKIDGKALPNEITTSVATEVELSSTPLLKGKITILIKHPNTQQMNNIEKVLSSVQNLRVISVTGSATDDSSIVVLADQPAPLIDILGLIPVVDEVMQVGSKEIRLFLKK